MSVKVYRAPVTIALGAWFSIERREFVIDVLFVTLRIEWGKQ